jgi:ATP-binding cassette subfamily F protein 3
VLTGANGAGKSTLLRVIAGTIEPSSGAFRLGAGVVPGIYAQEQETIDFTRSPLDQVRAVAPLAETDARSFLHLFLFGGEMVKRPAGFLSYGERARLQLALLVLRGANLLLLDEPLNHLDLTSRKRFEEALLQFDGTMIAVLHDRYAIQRLATRMVVMDNGRLREA